MVNRSTGHAVAHHGLLNQRRGRMRKPIGFTALAGTGDLFDVHPKDLREAHQDAMAIDAAPAALYLGKPSSDLPTSPASTACDRPRRRLARAIRCPTASRSSDVIRYRS